MRLTMRMEENPPMNLIPVYPAEPAFYYQCRVCGEQKSSAQCAAYADLDGIPFAAYVCTPCYGDQQAEAHAVAADAADAQAHVNGDIDDGE